MLFKKILACTPAILVLFFIFSFLFKTDTAFDQDLGRHIKLGEIILQSQSVPKTNLFSYTNPDFTFINTHWFFEVFSYLFVQNLGIGIYLYFKLAVIIFASFLTLKLVSEKNVFLLPLSFIFAHVLRERTELRPEIFSFLFTAASYYILEQFIVRAKSKTIWLLPFIQLIWINTHIYFFVGLALQVIFLVQLTYTYLRSHLRGGKPASPAGGLKALSLVFTSSILLSLINPNGIKGLFYPLTVNQNYGYQIVENQTIFFLESIGFSDPNFLFTKISWLLIIFILFAGLIRKKFTLADLLICTFGLLLSFLNVRSIPYLFFLSLPVILKAFDNLRSNSLFKVVNYLFVILLLIESFLYLNGDYFRYKDEQHSVGLYKHESVKNGMDFVLKHNLPAPIFNNFDIGSYIFYRGYPGYKVFVDGRPEAYPASFFQEKYVPIQYDYAKFKLAEKEFNFKTVIFSITDQTPWGQNFLKNIVADKEWKLVYIDDFVAVLTKSGTDIAENLPEVDLKKIIPDKYIFSNHRSYLNLAIFLINTGYRDNAVLFAQAAVSKFENSPGGNSILYNISGNVNFLDRSKNIFFW